MTKGKLFAAFVVVLAPITVFVSGMANPFTPAPSGGITPPCEVTISATATQATATIVSGCVGPGFEFRSFVGIRTNAQFAVTTSPPWVVNLPPCAWQVDFSFMPGTPEHKFIAALTGSGPCPPPTTTTTTTTTPPPSPGPTSPPSTTPTSPIPPTSTTPTTLPPIASEQQQIQVAPGVTAGNG